MNCPVCGSSSVYNINEPEVFRYVCLHCGAVGPVCSTEESAWDCFNERPQPVLQPDQVAVDSEILGVLIAYRCRDCPFDDDRNSNDCLDCVLTKWLTAIEAAKATFDCSPKVET